MTLESRHFAGLDPIAAFAGPATAQPAQTFEGAQQFLSITGQSLNARTIADDDGAVLEFRTRDLKQSVGLRCATSFANSYLDATPPGRGAIIWRDVAEMRADGRYVLIHQLDPKRGQRYFLRIDDPSDSLATRAAFAMEFLRQACDPTAGTGL